MTEIEKMMECNHTGKGTEVTSFPKPIIITEGGDIIVAGVRYRKVEEPQKPNTLYDICVDWYKDYDEDHPIEDLVEYIARNWLPKPIDYKAMGLGKQEWIDGYNSYFQTLIDTLGGENE